jgi:hypothetical protein
MIAPEREKLDAQHARWDGIMNDQSQGSPEFTETEQRAPDQILNDPEVRARIERAQARIREGKTRPGKTAEQLATLGHERQDLDA